MTQTNRTAETDNGGTSGFACHEIGRIPAVSVRCSSKSDQKTKRRKGEIMGKFMKFGVVVAVVLCAAGAFASNFRVADQIYVPAAGHIASSKTFITDVFISNLETFSVDVSVMFV